MNTPKPRKPTILFWLIVFLGISAAAILVCGGVVWYSTSTYVRVLNEAASDEKELELPAVEK